MNRGEIEMDFDQMISEIRSDAWTGAALFFLDWMEHERKDDLIRYLIGAGSSWHFVNGLIQAIRIRGFNESYNSTVLMRPTTQKTSVERHPTMLMCGTDKLFMTHINLYKRKPFTLEIFGTDNKFVSINWYGEFDQTSITEDTNRTEILNLCMKIYEEIDRIFEDIQPLTPA